MELSLKGFMLKSKKLKPVRTFILIALIASMLGGCSGNDGTALKKDDGGTGAVKTEDGQTGLKEATLTFYFNGQAKADTRKVLDEIEKQSKSSLNVKLDFKWINFNQNYQQEILKLLSSNEPIDAYCTSAGSDYQSILYDYGTIKDIKELLPRYAPTIYSQCETGDLQSVTFGGRMGFLPKLYPLTNAVYAVVRKDLCGKYGIREIKTYEDYEAYLKKVKENESAITPGIFVRGAGSTGMMKLYLPATDYSVIDYNYELVCRKDGSGIKAAAWEQTPEFRKMLELFTGWKVKQYFPRDELSADWWGYDYNWFARGKISSLLVSENDIGYSVEALVNASNRLLQASSGKKMELKAYRLYPEKKAQRLRAIDTYSFSYLAFAKKSKNTGRALSFVNWIMSDKKNYDLFMYGFEGEHYIPGNDNTYSLPDGIKPSASRYPGWSGSDAFRNIKFERYLAGDEQYDREDFLKKNTAFLISMGFYPDFKGVADAVNKRIENIYKIDSDFIQGQLNAGSTEAYISDMKNAGSDKVVQEIQNQINKWLTAK